MSPSNSYTASCWRESDAWVVHVVELDETARTPRLSQVEALAHDVVARFGGPGATAARVVIDLQVHDDLMQLLNAAAAARQDRDRVSVEAVTLRRGLARRLVAEGFAIKEVAALLGVSVPRAQQLVGEPSRVPDRTPALVAAPARPVVTEVAPPRKPHGSYQHEAFIYRGDD